MISPSNKFIHEVVNNSPYFSDFLKPDFTPFFTVTKRRLYENENGIYLFKNYIVEKLE
jgi:hypothetical protein